MLGFVGCLIFVLHESFKTNSEISEKVLNELMEIMVLNIAVGYYLVFLGSSIGSEIPNKEQILGYIGIILACAVHLFPTINTIKLMYLTYKIKDVRNPLFSFIFVTLTILITLLSTASLMLLLNFII